MQEGERDRSQYTKAREGAMECGYQQVPIGNGRVRFTVTPARLPRAGGAAIAASSLGAGIAGALLPFAIPLVVRAGVAALAGVGIARAWLARRRHARERRRAPGGTFVASPWGVESGALTLFRDAGLSLEVANAFGESPT